ncbi:MAG: transcription elongation factor GreA [Deltaproteobacteria bacterium]|nr:MAG: transcription elongation factor GreA [Deltaproteobacteria bacterium]
MKRNPVTPEGLASLEADLKHHKSVLRPQNVRDIEEARAHGDISENAEYEAAKERQALIEGRIAQLENLVATAEVVDVMKLPQDGRVVFGTTVVLENEEGDERTWRIVGATETDVNAGKISYLTPVAKACIGKREGDEVVVPAPGGSQTWEIVEVRYEA